MTASPTRTASGRSPIIVIDGPAGSGKSTTAREVARILGYRHLDSGALYRALTWALLQQRPDPGSWPLLHRSDLDDLGIEVEPRDRDFLIRVGGREVGQELRTPDVTRHVSALAELAPVRDWLLDFQRRAGAGGGLVAEGRDMGTVVFPDAEVKVYLTADIQERARRRLVEQGVGSPTLQELETEAARITDRDKRDAEREHSPLKRDPDAMEIDTSGLDFDEQVRRIVDLVRSVALG